MKRIEFREDLNDIEYNLYKAQCLYLGETPKVRSKSNRVLKICGKTSDLFSARLFVDDKLERVHDGYVPEFFPNEHYGDYIELDIDIDSGQILNWKKPTKKELTEQLNNERY